MSTFFFFNDTATTEIYTLSLHDALPICGQLLQRQHDAVEQLLFLAQLLGLLGIVPDAGIFQRGVYRAQSFVLCIDRKSTRLNSSHGYISYAVFCLKKKKRNSHYALALSE